MPEQRDQPMSQLKNLRTAHPRVRALLAIIVVAGLLGGIIVYVHAVQPRSTQPHSTQPQFPLPTPTLTGDPAWLCQHAAETTNPTLAENYCPGTTSWRIDHPIGPVNAIEGFTAPVSLNVGEKLALYVSTTAATYSYRIYRMGWYHQLGGRLVYSSSTLPGINQPSPTIDPVTRMVSCSDWSNPVTLTIPSTWVSGVYIIKMLSSQGYMRYTPFVVRQDTSHSPILFQISVLTYQAYNLWGGYSLYRGLNSQGVYTTPNRAYIVSFDRPYDRSDGLGDFPLYAEYNTLRWIEHKGYNVSYSTDIDTNLRGALLLQHRLFLAAGHDEYWSTAMRDNVTSARNKGISLAFFGSNDIYWHVRLQDSPLGPDREVICYKAGYYNDGAVDPLAAKYPQEATVLWRDPPLSEPENALLGEMYGGGSKIFAAVVLAARAVPFLRGTGLHVGSAIPGLIADEYDRIYQNGLTPSSLTILAASPLKCQRTTLCPASGNDTSDTTIYTTASGAKVLDTGTYFWGWGLDDNPFDPSYPFPPHPFGNPGFQTFTAHLLTYMLEPPER